MNSTMKQLIIAELDTLSDRKGYSLLDYLHFLRNEAEDYLPNDTTLNSIKEVEDNKSTLKSYSSSDELFSDLDI